ncbi:MAG: transcriptional repressor [Chloroflexi bacterium]|nr:transcriptional repressor [Chloroflexota bacterium]
MQEPRPPLMSNARYEALSTALKRAGYRLTPQRLAICEYLANSREHPSPAEVYEHVRAQYPTMSRATVYNTLNVLRDLGEIIEIRSGAEGVRYETDLTPHANLICLRCGRIIDFPLDRMDAIRKDMVEAAGFELRGFRVDGFGLCAECKKEETEQIGHD